MTLVFILKYEIQLNGIGTCSFHLVHNSLYFRYIYQPVIDVWGHKIADFSGSHTWHTNTTTLYEITLSSECWSWLYAECIQNIWANFKSDFFTSKENQLITLSVWHFTRNWCNTFTVHFRSLIKLRHYCMYSFVYFPGVWLYADVSEHSICSIFIGWVSIKSQFTKYWSNCTPAGLLHILTLLIVECRAFSTATVRLQTEKCVSKVAFYFKLEQNGLCRI